MFLSILSLILNVFVVCQYGFNLFIYTVQILLLNIGSLIEGLRGPHCTEQCHERCVQLLKSRTLVIYNMKL